MCARARCRTLADAGKATPVPRRSATLPYRPPWTEAAIRGFLDGPPMGALVMLDLYAEQSPLWRETKGFWGHPWVFSTIFNGDENVRRFTQRITLPKDRS